MQLYLLALNPTDSVTEGFLPAARRLGLDITLLTDQPEAHRAACPDIELLECDVRDFRAVITRISAHRPPDAVFSNSDHLQTQTALAADYFGLPAKSWQAALRTKDKAEMRRHLAAAGQDTVRSVELAAGQDPVTALAALDLPYPCVIKPREGVASEDVVLVEGPGDLVLRCKEIRAHRPGASLVVEEYLPGELYTLETLGDGRVLHVLGGFHTALSPPPYFIEERLTYVEAHPEPVVAQVLARLDALGVGLGACHTEFVVHEGRARIIEVNYRAIGDQCDLLLARLLDVPLFEHILRTHLGVPLPADLEARTGGAARLDYPCAQRSGTLTAAPAATELTLGDVQLTYRPLRRTGERHELHRTNRDLLGVVRAIGGDQKTVDRVVTDFVSAHRWEITP
ncbi:MULTISPECIES: ATP-grasp domain-containing protein [unclassified Streptomyces]|uniref:ATP-grasp domain-containing protein n=1 Tax=unclassified Streptomyces TaxID=2593676 RepID=UPI002DDC29FD|nr:ATP-grasp domain-containing protein [Streptomyces sp. NBC_01750]WSA98768.1 ATP-grasp domain-containing protein [Streptomyces sp. NBC_01794]WSD36663.1 ATP-grasp domain-containing protein [Streptomyces sp. NBC_01750]